MDGDENQDEWAQWAAQAAEALLPIVPIGGDVGVGDVAK
jgi:hypothetical protein